MVVQGGCAHDCPDTCAWQVTVEDGRAVKLAGDPGHPYTRGGLCAKVNRYLDRVYSPDRVLHPLRRAGAKGEGRFVQVSWEEALSDMAARLNGIIDTHGAEAVLPYSFAGNMGLVQYAGMDRRFFARLGASRLDRTICGNTANSGVIDVLGSSSGMLPEDIVHSRYIVIWGANPVVTNVHLWPLIREARARGARLVVIDPVETRTAREADWHLRPFPGSDAVLALGLVNVIASEGLHDARWLADHSEGWPLLEEASAAYPPDRVETLTGIAAADVVRLAREYATTRPACIRTLVGPEKNPDGAAAFRAIASLPAVVGAWRDPGGGLLHWTRSFFSDAFDTRAVARPDLARTRTRAISMIQVGQALTDPDLEPPVAALIVYNANPAVIAPNSNLVRRGLAREDLFTVVSELFVTDTARYADYVLPATSFIEHWDLLFPWGHTYAVLNRPAIAPLGEAVSNCELFRRLAAALGWEEAEFSASDEQLVRAAVPGGDWEQLFERGWVKLDIEEGARFAAGGFPTESGRCRLWDPSGWSPADSTDAAHPLAMVSGKYALHFLNSSYAQLPRHRRQEGDPWVALDPEDARSRGIAEGQRVRVFNQRGELELVARIGGVRPGVVAVPHGYWGAQANALTSDGLADAGGGGDFYSTRVEVAPLA